MKDNTKKELIEIIDDRLEKAFSAKAVPMGYTKCSKCGKLITTDSENCPYCFKLEPDKEDEGEDFP